MHLTWIEISKKALQNNIAEIKKCLSKKTKFMAVVKANAYGHGLLEVVKAVKSKVDYFAVYAFEDAILMRKKGVKTPILVLSRIFENQVNLAIKHDIIVTLSTFDIVQKVKKPLRCHICLDSGLGRDGFLFSDLETLLKLLKKSPLRVEGIYAHFATADQNDTHEYTQNQLHKLLIWKEALQKIYPKILTHHLASAAAVFGKVKDSFDIARIGVSLYGNWPSEDVRKAREKIVKLSPALSWRAKITELRNLPKGSKISYNCTYELKRDSKLATLPIGYFDGFARLASNKAFAIVKGKKVRQIGRVTMNLLVPDVTDVPNVKIGDVATIIGKDGKEEITAADAGKFGDTSCYEVTTRLNSAIKRILA